MKNKKLSKLFGFSLIEIISTVVIIGVLGGITTFAVTGIIDNAERASCENEFNAVEFAIESYNSQNGTFPSAVVDLQNAGLVSSNFETAQLQAATIDSSGNLSVTRAELCGSTTSGVTPPVNPEPTLAAQPAGTVADYVGETAPDGWALMNGQTLVDARNVFPELWNTAPTEWRNGNNLTLPDLRGRVTVGAGEGAGLENRALGSSGGAETHTIGLDELPAHTHDISHQNTATATTGSAGNHSHTVNNHTHTMNHSHSASSGAAGNHSHTINNHTHSGRTGGGGNHQHSIQGVQGGSFAGGGFPFAAFGFFPNDNNQRTNFAGNHTHAFTTGNPSDRGTSTAGNHTHTITVNAFSGSTGGSAPGTNSTGAHTHSVTVTVNPFTGNSGSTGGGQAQNDNNMQPWFALNKIIKVS